MDDLTAFLKAVRENPASDAARLAFSDWLREWGREWAADAVRDRSVSVAEFVTQEMTQRDGVWVWLPLPEAERWVRRFEVAHRDRDRAYRGFESYDELLVAAWAAGLPVIGDPHPADPDMTVREVRLTPDPAGSCVVAADVTYEPSEGVP